MANIMTETIVLSEEDKLLLDLWKTVSGVPMGPELYNRLEALLRKKGLIK